MIIALENAKANPALVDVLKRCQVHIYSGEHMAFWGPDNAGYFNSDGAGLYDGADAFAKTHSCGPEKKIEFWLVRPIAAYTEPTSMEFPSSHKGEVLAAAPAVRTTVRQFRDKYLITHRSIDELASYLNNGWPGCVGDRSIQAFLVSFCDDAPESDKEVEDLKFTLRHSHQATNCGKCGKFKHTPWRDDVSLGEDGGYGYVCATCFEAIQTKRVEDLMAASVYLFNLGYLSGHNDTVEGQFIDISHREKFSYHADEVKNEILPDALRILGETDQQDLAAMPVSSGVDGHASEPTIASDVANPGVKSESLATSGYQAPSANELPSTLATAAEQMAMQLADCIETFQAYARIHREKNTPEGTTKAVANEEKAQACIQALAPYLAMQGGRG